MIGTTEDKQIELYLQQIGRFFPYAPFEKKNALESLRHEIEDAVQDSESPSLEEAFGSPYEVAKNFSSNYEWKTRQAWFGSRLGAYLIDLSIGLWLSVVWILTINQIGNFYEKVHYDLINSVPFISWDNDLLVLILYQPLILTFFVGLYLCGFGLPLLSEGLFSTTIGKKSFSLLVCDISGIRINWEQTIIRNLSKLLPGPIILELLLGRRNHQSQHSQRPLEILANTTVVRQIHQKPSDTDLTHFILFFAVLFFIFSSYIFFYWWIFVLKW